MENKFRTNSFIIHKVLLRDSQDMIKEVKKIPLESETERQAAINLIMAARQNQHNILRLAKKEYPAIKWDRYV